MTAVHTSLAAKQLPAQLPAPPDFHVLKMALAVGDILVLATNYNDEYGYKRREMFPLIMYEVVKIEHTANKVHWIFEPTYYLDSKVATLATFSVSQPVRTIRNRKGLCTLFTIEVQHGYRIHYLDFVKNRLPEIYKQLRIS
jgi:hypothetical protein